jgi:hypothetical protein
MSPVKYEKVEFNKIFMIKRTFYGEITIPEVWHSFNHLLENELTEHHNIEGIITDLTQASLKFNLIEFRSLLSFLRRSDVYANLSMAVIVDSPISMLFPSIASKVVGMKIKPFDSFDKAVEWINTNSQKIK